MQTVSHLAKIFLKQIFRIFFVRTYEWNIILIKYRTYGAKPAINFCPKTERGPTVGKHKSGGKSAKGKQSFSFFPSDDTGWHIGCKMSRLKTNKLEVGRGNFELTIHCFSPTAISIYEVDKNGRLGWNILFFSEVIWFLVRFDVSYSNQSPDQLLVYEILFLVVAVLLLDCSLSDKLKCRFLCYLSVPCIVVRNTEEISKFY